MRVALWATGFLGGLAQAQLSVTCSPTLTPARPLPSVAPGYAVRLIANGLTLPRSIKFDAAGHLLVVESGVGVSSLNLTDYGGGCLEATGKTTVVAQSTLNHGLELSPDGTILYASDPDKAYKWAYSATAQTVSGAATILVQGMNNSSPDHVTRTLYLSKTAPGMMAINRGSNIDIDYAAEQLSSGLAQIRAFNLNVSSNFPYNFNTSGTVMGWGLRNDVGMDEQPVTGGLYSVENGVNDETRDGTSIRQTNPAEEMNFLGYIGGNPPSPNMGANFGYPECFTVWNTSIPNFNGKVGQVVGMVSSNDTSCATQHQAPRLVFAAHSAPISLLFNDAGTTAWITFRGADKITSKTGYGVGIVSFSNGQPVATVNSKTALTYIAQSRNYKNCNKNICWAPVGLAWDSQGRLFMSCDISGEIYVILRSDGTGPNS